MYMWGNVWSHDIQIRITCTYGGTRAAYGFQVSSRGETCWFWHLNGMITLHNTRICSGPGSCIVLSAHVQLYVRAQSANILSHRYPTSCHLSWIRHTIPRATVCTHYTCLYTIRAHWYILHVCRYIPTPRVSPFEHYLTRDHPNQHISPRVIS